jgi:hypothetical protein
MRSMSDDESEGGGKSVTKENGNKKRTSFDANKRGCVVHLVGTEGVEEEVEVGGSVDVRAEFRCCIISITRHRVRKRNTHQQRQS